MKARLLKEPSLIGNIIDSYKTDWGQKRLIVEFEVGDDTFSTVDDDITNFQVLD